MVKRNDEHKVFVRELAQQLGPGPIAVQWSAEKRSIVFILFHLSWMTLVMALGRSFSWPGPEQAAHWLHLSVELVLIFLTMASFIYLCFLSMVPGALGRTFFRSVMLFGASVGLFWMTQIFVETPVFASQMRSFCEIKLFFLALVPLGHFFFLVRRGGFESYSKTALSAGLAAGLIPAFVMHLACSREPLHVVLFHLLPTLGLVAVSFFVYKRVTKSSFGELK